MFGYVIANSDILSEAEKARYKAVYCGLCHALGQRHGRFGRLTLNYDMVFLILVLNSLCEPDVSEGQERCIVHPASRHSYSTSEITDYAADMNVALAYLNQLDNWHDDKNFMSLIFARMLKGKYAQIALMYPRQCQAMEACISKLSALEKACIHDPDAGAKLFGELMGQLFVMREDRWSNTTRAMASALGEFIYILDAVCDLEGDMKHRRYNPLTELKNAGRSYDYFKDILTMLIGNCTIEFEKLPLVDDLAIMRNILYSGVWTKFDPDGTKKRKAKGNKHNDVRPL